MNKPLGFPFGFFVNDNTPDSGRYFNRDTGLPYASMSAVNDLLPEGVRHPGLTINLAGVEYWWPPDDEDVSKDPVIKEQGGGGTGTGELTLNTKGIIIRTKGEFSLDPVPVANTAGTKYFNAVYEFNVLADVSPEKSDFIYMVEEDLARLSTVDEVIIEVYLFSNGFINPTTLIPGINSLVKADIDLSDWSVNGADKDTALDLPFDIQGSINDDSLIRGIKLLTERGYKVGLSVIPVFVDTAAVSAETAVMHRKDITWDDLSDATAWIDSYEAYFKAYIDLVTDNGIQLTWAYLGSEMDSLTTHETPTFNAAWIASLKEMAAYSKKYQPGCAVTYAASLIELGYINNRFYLDYLWLDVNVDCIGANFFAPIEIEHSNETDIIRRGIVQGEDLDYTLSGIIEANRKFSADYTLGKTQLTQTPIPYYQGNKNIRSYVNGYHYVAPRDGYVADASPIAQSADLINRVFDSKSSQGMTGTALLGDSGNYSFIEPGGKGNKFNLYEKWVEANEQYGLILLPATLIGAVTDVSFLTVAIDFEITALTTTSNTPRVFKFGNCFEVFVDKSDGNKVKLNFLAPDPNQFIVLENAAVLGAKRRLILNFYPAGGSEFSFISSYGSEDGQISQNNSTLVVSQSSVDFLIPDGEIFLFGSSETTDLAKAKIFRFEYQLTAGSVYGGVFNFEDALLGVRNEWDVNFKFEYFKPLVVTGMGVASVNGSLVEPVAESMVLYSGSPTGFVFPASHNLENYFTALEAFGYYLDDIDLGPYGTTYESDEEHQLKGLIHLINAFYFFGVAHQFLSYLDARYHGALKGTQAGALAYKNAPEHLINQALNGKQANGYQGSIITKLLPS